MPNGVQGHRQHQGRANTAGCCCNQHVVTCGSYPPHALGPASRPRSGPASDINLKPLTGRYYPPCLRSPSPPNVHLPLQRSAVLDMSLLRSTPHQELWRPFRALYAPKVVVLHPDPDAVYNSKKAATNSKTSNKRSKSTYASITSTRYLDQYGHDVTSYYEECTTDLDGLSFNAFDELDAESTHMGACGKADGLSVTMARWHVHAMELIYTAAVLFLVSELPIAS